MHDLPSPLGTWRLSEDKNGLIEASLLLDGSSAGIEARRRLYHDYLAAVRTLRYLAQKGLKAGQEKTDPAKQAAFDKHLKNLEVLQTLLIAPLLHPPEKEQPHVP